MKKVVNVFEILILSYLISVIYSWHFPPESMSRIFRFVGDSIFRTYLDFSLIVVLMIRIGQLVFSFRKSWIDKGKLSYKDYLFPILWSWFSFFDMTLWIDLFIQFQMCLPYIIIFSLPILFWLVEFSVRKWHSSYIIHSSKN